MAKLLIIDDETSILDVLSIILEYEGHDVALADDFDTAKGLIQNQSFDLIFSDIMLGQANGLDLLPIIREQQEDCLTVLMTGMPSAETAVEALHHDVFDYLFKPVLRDQILRTTERALRHLQQQRRIHALEEENKRYQHRLEQQVELKTLEANVSEMRYTRLIEASFDAIFTLDGEEISYANPAAHHLLAVHDSLSGKEIQQFLSDSSVSSSHHLLLDQQESSRIEWVMKKADGSEFEAELSITPLNVDDQHLSILVVRDVSERKNWERHLEARHAEQDLLNELLMMSMEDIDLDVLIQRLSKRLFGMHLNGIRGGAVYLKGKNSDVLLLKAYEGSQDFPKRMHLQGENLRQVFEADLDEASSGCLTSGSCMPIVSVEGVLGALCFADLSAAEDGGFIQAVANTLGSIIQQRRTTERLGYLSYYDELTQLPNRRLMHDRIEQAVELARRHKQKIAVLYLDIDRFKRINDTYGHSMGDEMLVKIARRIRMHTRMSDSVSRLSGDEFAVLLSDLRRSEDAYEVAEKIRQEIMKKMLLSDQEIYTSCSIGITVFTGEGTAEDLLKQADTAMYRAKQKKNSIVFYASDMGSMMLRYAHLESDLRLAVQRDEFTLAFQPKVDVHSRRILGAEALIRWQHNDQWVSPAEFIAIAEESDVIIEISHWVLDTVCKSLQKLKQQGLNPGRIFLNLSPKQFSDVHLFDHIHQAIQKYDLSCQNLGIEITESLAMSRPEHAIDIFNKLQDIGVHVAIDDFGTGHSSLSRLWHLPLSEVKIDRSFIIDMIQEEGARLLVDMVILISHKLGLKAVAEGVETLEQVELLQSMGCDLIQGYYFSRPLTFDDFVISLKHKTLPLS